jgi:hypothetical protein
MGNCLFDCCYKDSELNERILNQTENKKAKHKLVRISDIIETKTVDWTDDHFSEMRYKDTLNEAMFLKNKIQNRY